MLKMLEIHSRKKVVKKRVTKGLVRFSKEKIADKQINE